jgi:hypothetical protein
MDAAIQLALMSKARKVFGSEGTFLSFPLSPLPYSRRQLDFLAQQDAAALRDSLHYLEEFSTLVNLLPGGEAWVPDEPRFLWDEYAQLLRDADLAASSRSPEEEAAYRRALDYLREAAADGRWQDSAPVQAYRRCKDAWLLAQQGYLAAKGTADASDDADEQRQWRDRDEPARRAELDALQLKWIVEGHKNEVEAAQGQVTSLGARSPQLTWEEWRSHFNRDIDALADTSLTGSSYFPSFYAPANALDEGAWQPFKLSGNEVQALLREAGAAQRQQFAADDAAPVKALSFEFSTAAIMRPWFAPAALRARFWRFADAGRMLSDGATPPAGSCPAYVTAVVFARKVAVEAADAGGAPPRLFDGFRFDAALRQRLRAGAVTPPPPLVAGRPGPRVATPLRVATPVLAAGPLATPAPGAVQMLRASAVLRTVAQPAHAALAARSLAGGPAMAAGAALAAGRAAAGAAPAAVAPAAVVPAAAPPPSPPQPAADPAIYILAFICKSVPKCPDPDPALQW